MFILDFFVGFTTGFFIFRPKLKKNRETQTDAPPVKTAPMGIPHLRDFWTHHIPE
jgi:hypothetical protein